MSHLVIIIGVLMTPGGNWSASQDQLPPH